MADTPVEVYVLKLDPLDYPMANLTPFVMQRVLDASADREIEGDPALFTQQLYTRLVSHDPTLLCLMAVTVDSQIVGHCVTTFEQHGLKKWLFIWQWVVDDPKAHLEEKFISALRQYGAQVGTQAMLGVFAHGREKAMKKLGFSPYKAFMSFDLAEGETE